MGFFVSGPTSPVALLFFTSSFNYNTYFDMGFFVSGPPSPVALLFFTSSIDYNTYFDMGFLSQDLLPRDTSLLFLLTTILTLTLVSLSQDLLPPWHFSFSSINYNTYFDIGFFVSRPPSSVALLFFYWLQYWLWHGFLCLKTTFPCGTSLFLLLTTILTLTLVSLSQDLLPQWHSSSSSLLLLTTILTLTWVSLSQDLLPLWHISSSSIDYNTYSDMVSLPQDLLPPWHFSSSINYNTYFDMGLFVSGPPSPLALLFFFYWLQYLLWHGFLCLRSTFPPGTSLLLLLTTILTLTWVSLPQDLLPPWYFSSSSINYNTYFDMGLFVSGPPSPVALLFFFY